MNPQNIYCVEGDWEKKPSNSISVLNALNFLKSIHGINFEIKNCITKEELGERLRLYGQTPYNRYGVFYFACHGSKGYIRLRDGKKHELSLEKVAEIAGIVFKDKIIHFGCCNTLQNQKKAEDFLQKTGAKAICGYKKTVPFLKSTLLDMLLFEKIQDFKSAKAIWVKMNTYYQTMINELGFVMYY